MKCILITRGRVCPGGRTVSGGTHGTTPLVTHRFPLERIEEAYRIFENRLDGVIKVAVTGAASTSFSAR